jgi:hypothetical protein
LVDYGTGKLKRIALLDDNFAEDQVVGIERGANEVAVRIYGEASEVRNPNRVRSTRDHSHGYHGDH